MAITFNNLITNSSDHHKKILKFGEDIGNKFMALWDTLLDDDNGISEEAYNKLVELGKIIDPVFVDHASDYVDSANGRFSAAWSKGDDQSI